MIHRAQRFVCRTSGLCGVLVVSGCVSQGDLRPDSSTDSTPVTSPSTTSLTGSSTEGCGNELLWIWPEDESTDVYYRAYLEAMILEMEPAVIELYDEGEWHDAILYLIGPHLQLMPIVPMKPNHTYELRLDWTCGSESLWFTTGDGGHEVNIDDWATHGWTLDLSQGTVREPLGFEHEVFAALEGRGVALQTDRTDGYEVEGLSTWTLGGAQDVCVSTTSVSVSVRNPFLIWDLPSLGARESDALHLHDVKVSADVFDEGQTLIGGRLEGMVDTRDWAVPKGFTSVCDALAERYAWCRPCPDDGFESCVTFRMEGIPGVASEESLVRWTSSDVSGQKACP
jgi:hypothetical protein